MKAEHEKQIHSLSLLALRLRALILALGESVDPAWWKTKFMSEAGLRFLEKLFPRTSFQAGVNAAGRAACDAHDRAVGRVGVYHLFRLPEALEVEIARIPPGFDEDFVSGFRAGLGHPGKLMELLAMLCGGVAGADATPGAKRIGPERDLMTDAGFERMAAMYHHAFAQGKPCFPYCGGDQIGAG